MIRPNRTFALLSAFSFALLAAAGWSTHHLLLAGAPTLATGGPPPAVSCILLPLAGDFGPHVASYAFLLAFAAGSFSGLRTLVRQHRQTRALLAACRPTRGADASALAPLARPIGLDQRLDLADLAAPVAFCYGYLRPRVLLSTALVSLLAPEELEALLLHEREHVRQRDPCKIVLGRLLSSGLFFIPAIGALYQRYLIEKELAADAAVVAQQGSSRYLAGALVRLLESGGSPRPALSAGADEALEHRVAALLGERLRDWPRPSWATRIRSLALVLLALLPLAAAPDTADMVASSHNVVAQCHMVAPAAAEGYPAGSARQG